MVGLRQAGLHRRVGIVEIMGEPPPDLQVLVIAVGPQALGPFLGILPTERLLVQVAGSGRRRAVNQGHGAISSSPAFLSGDLRLPICLRQLEIQKAVLPGTE